ncbi:hypothetical protein DL96DRAFT_1621458 [Flagelloscypha sp. PMI_526]|nr:hypothetical protein DL96DRAFT_1621458 [Flagelloscypha sp. PMI_526]
MGRIPPRFPPELERPIFTYAANQSPKTLSSLLLVARRVHQWIEPLQYSTLDLGPDTSSGFIRMISEKPSDFLGTRVSVLLLTSYSEIYGMNWFSSASHILRHCLGLVDLTFDAYTSLTLDFGVCTKLQTLTLSYFASEAFRNLLRDNPTFSLPSITHIEYFSDHLPSPDTIVLQLSGLTHFLLVGWNPGHPQQIKRYILLQQIRRIVILQADENPDAWMLSYQPPIPDNEKLVSVFSDNEFVRDCGGRSRQRTLGHKIYDIWTLAEEIAESRVKSERSDCIE